MKNSILHNFKFKCAVSFGIAASSFVVGGLFNEVSANGSVTETVQSLLAQYNNFEGNVTEQNRVKQELVNFMLANGGENVVQHLSIEEMTSAELNNVVTAFVAATSETDPLDESLEDTEDLEEDLEETEELEEELEEEIEEEVEEPVIEEPVEPEPEPEPEPELPKVRQANPTAPTLKNSNNQAHVVRAGETLYSIARVHNTTASKLAALNNLSNPSLIRVGQQLKIHNQNVNSAAAATRNNGSTAAQPASGQPLAKTGNEFIDRIAAEASQVAAEHNLYASVMIAQATLESGYGRSSLSSPPHHNLFGIKGSYNGKSVNKFTQEDTRSGMITIRDNFRSYPNYSASFRDNADKLRNGLSWNRNFYSGTWRENTSSYRDATAWLTGRYATDRNYNTKLNALIERWGLTRFDNGPYTSVSNPGQSTKPAPSQPSRPSNPSNGLQPSTPSRPSTPSAGSYTVKSGDTIYGISNRFGISMNQLRSLNGLTSNLIVTGQSLKVNTGTSSSPVTRPSTPSVPTAGSYTVKSGDTVYGISNRFGVSMNQLRSLNGLSSNLIVPGQLLRLSQSNASTPVSNPSKPANGTYTVKSGDTIYGISNRFGMSMDQLRSVNGLSSNLIVPGQLLKVSGSNSSPSTPVSNPSTPASGSYTVKSGDTIYGISNRFGMSMDQLRSVNGLSSNLIVPGQLLKVSGSNSSPSTPVSNPSTPASGSYTVKSGDTIYGISNRHGMSMSQLRSLNGLTSDLISPGQVLRLAQSNTAATQTQPATPSSQATYTVKSGDTLFRIAMNHNTTVPKLRALNTISNDVITPGQVLKVSEVSNVKSTPAPSKPTVSSNATYTVQPGDTLYKVGQQHNLSVSELKSLNNLSSDLIQPNQVLTVRRNQTISKPAPKPAPVNSSSIPLTYTVKAGDTLSSIARRYDLSVSQLNAWNQLSNADLLSIGQTLQLRLRTDNVNRPVTNVSSHHTVASGDSLFSIARSNNTTVANLKSLNNLSSDLIVVGQQLRVR